MYVTSKINLDSMLQFLSLQFVKFAPGKKKLHDHIIFVVAM